MFDQFLTDRVTIRRAAPNRTVSATGNAKEVWTTLKSNVSASVQQRGVGWAQIEPGQRESTRWKAYFHGTEDVRLNDEIVTVDGRVYKAGTPYNLGVHQEVELTPHEE